MGLLSAYPFDGYKRTGIRRLVGYRLSVEGRVTGVARIPAGGQWGEERIKLRLLSHPELDASAGMPKDSALQAGLEQITGGKNESYGIAVLDITDPDKLRYAGVREDVSQLPGSVGKLLIGVGFLSEVAKVYPSTSERERFLRETVRAADNVVYRDGKTAPYYEIGDKKVVRRRVEAGDKFNLWEWLDHMLSRSSNAAGSYVWKEAVLLRKFGNRYPPSPAEEKAFLTGTSRKELGEVALEALEEPMRASGLDPAKLRLGTTFTSGGRKYFQGTRSYATPRELLRWLLRMEQGRLVDEWTSLETKKLIYFSRSRYRYASAPILNKAGVFFKSGSFYQCVEEEGFTCKAYAGNKTNIMNSIAVVESEGRVYLVALMSNILRTNSAVEHQRIATEVEKLIQRTAPAG